MNLLIKCLRYKKSQSQVICTQTIMETSPIIFFHNKETTSLKNEKVLSAEGTYKTNSGSVASYAYSVTVTYYQGGAWVHLQGETIVGFFSLLYI